MHDIVMYHLDVDPDQTTMTANEINAKLEKHVRSKYNVLLDKLTFARRMQAQGEDFDSYVAELCRLRVVTELCDGCRDDSLRTQILIGLRSETV